MLVWEAAVGALAGSPVGRCGVLRRRAALTCSLPAAVGDQLTPAFVQCKGCAAPSHSLLQPAEGYLTKVRPC